MSALLLIEVMILITAALTVALVVATLFVRLLRSARESWYKARLSSLEPALEGSLATDTVDERLLRVGGWQRDLLLSPMMAERVSLLRGRERESLLDLARELGLVDRHRRMLRSRSRFRRARSAEYLGYLGGEQDIAALGKLLADSDETARAVAARSLVRIGGKRAAGILAGSLNDTSELTRLRAAENLERLGEAAIEPLAAHLGANMAFRSPGLPGAEMATRVLGNLRAYPARPVLRAAAAYGATTNLRAQAALALGKLGDPEDLDVLIGRSARDGSWPVRAQAANALAMIGDTSSIPCLTALASDAAWWVRLNACRALANMGPEGESALIGVLRSPDRYARARAAATMEERGITLKMVERLGAPGESGRRARQTVETIISAGFTNYIESLARRIPEGPRRAYLERLLYRAADS